jgi:hypothetical protein
MALAFSDVAGALGYTFRPYADYILAAAHLPALTPGQGLMLQSWMATASGPAGGASGAGLTPAQIGRLCQHWAYSLGCTMPQIGIYCADNM